MRIDDGINMSPRKHNVVLMKGSLRGIGGGLQPPNRKETRLQSVQMIRPNLKVSNRSIDKRSFGKISKHRYNKIMSDILQKLKIEDKEDDNCVICCENPSDVVFYPCYHGSICAECALNHLTTQSNCLLCRAVAYDSS